MNQPIRVSRTLADAPPGFIGIRGVPSGQPIHLAVDAIAGYGPEEWDRRCEPNEFIGCPIYLKGQPLKEATLCNLRLREIAHACIDAIERAKQ